MSCHNGVSKSKPIKDITDTNGLIICQWGGWSWKPCGCPTFLGGRQEGNEARGEEGFPIVFRWPSNVHNFLRVCSLPGWQMLLENLYYSEERLTFQEWERGREAAHTFGEEMTLNRTASYPEHAGSLKGCVITLPKRTVLGEISFHHGFPCHEFKLVFKTKY